MNAPAAASTRQPLTFGGVAAYARARLRHLWAVQGLVALLVTGTLLWFLYLGWFPALHEAIDRLADGTELRGGQLVWAEAEPVLLAETPFLSITVDLLGVGDLGRSADLQLELRRDELILRSLLGYVRQPYPQGWRVALSPADVRAWWGAWQTPVAIGCGLASLLLLLVLWHGVALVYSVPVWCLAFYADRAVSWAGCWRLAAAALLPGSILLAGATMLYSLHRLNLVGLMLGWGVHVAVGWVYCAAASLRLPRRTEAPGRRGNPFGHV